MPPVKAKLTYTHFILFLSNSLSFIISANAMTANIGMVNSATTNMDDTVRNLLYKGMLSIQKLVNPIKLCPQESSMLIMVATNNPHFRGPFTIKRASINSISTNAPTYTGPEVIGWSPQYWSTCLYIWLN